MLELMFDGDNYQLNASAVPMFMTGTIVLLLAATAAVHERGSRVVAPFLWLAGGIVVWMYGAGAMYSAVPAALAHSWALVAHIGAVTIAPAGLYLAVRVVNDGEFGRRVLGPAWVGAGIFVLLTALTGDFVVDVRSHWWGWYPEYGTLGALFAVFCLGVTLMTLAVYARRLRGDDTRTAMVRRTRLLMFSVLVGMTGAIDFLPAFGIPVFPTGYASVLLAFMLTTYVTIRYRLVDITAAYAGHHITRTITDALLVTDRHGTVRLANPSAVRLLGDGASDLVGLSVNAVLSPGTLELDPLGLAETAPDDEVRCRLPNDPSRLLGVTTSVMRDHFGDKVGSVYVLRDITEREEAQERIKTLAYYDDLTSLPNRFQFHQHLGERLQRADDEGDQLTMLFLDLDRFKRINDTLGHSAGDLLLKLVAERLRHCVRGNDVANEHANRDGDNLVARLGGDEFIVTLAGICEADDVRRVAARILEALAAPFQLDSHEVFVSASIGVSRFPEDGTNVQMLLKNADTALYHAKDSGRNNFQFYRRAMSAQMLEKLAMESDLRKAFERGEFELHYQPQVDHRSGRIIGSEALLRWRQPDRGLVPPQDFIPLAEESGLIVQIGEWVLDEACRQTKLWHDAGYGNLSVAVNLSERQFRRADLAQTVARMLGQHGLEPRYLDIELTETMVMRDAQMTIDTLNSLKLMGVQISIDDFGTGYSSLGYLKRFPIDVIKIDGAFLREVATSQDDIAITQAIIGLARSLNLGVIAEGVETPDQVAFLEAEGCHLMQGYMFGRPMTGSQLGELLAARAYGNERQDEPRDDLAAQIVHLGNL